MNPSDYPKYYRWLTISDQQMLGVLFCALLASVAVIWILTARYSFPGLLPLIEIALTEVFYTVALYLALGLVVAIAFNAIIGAMGAIMFGVALNWRIDNDPSNQLV